jgi:uncharacterized membrane protein YqiK
MTGADAIAIIVLLTILVAVGVYLLHWLYRHSSKDEAFVRTGLGGEKIVMGGGAFVIPIVHDITRVNMNTVPIEIRRTGEGSLITRNKLRVDVVSEYSVRVIPTRENVSLAARTFGERTYLADQMKDVVQGRFVDAISAVAATMTMDEIHTGRKQFMRQVSELVSASLASNGLELENASLTSLNQSDISVFNPDNAFDAEGLTQLTEEIEGRRKLRNRIENDARLEIKLKDYETEQRAIEIDRDLEYARLDQARDIEARRTAQLAAIEEERSNSAISISNAKIRAEQEAERVRIAKDKLIDAERINSQTEIRLLEIDRQKENEQRAIETSKALEAQRIVSRMEVESQRIENERKIRESEINSRQEVSIVEANASARVDQTKLESERQVETSRIEIEKAIEALLVEKDKHIRIINELANTDKEKAIILKRYNIEVERLKRDEEVNQLEIEKNRKIRLSETAAFRTIEDAAIVVNRELDELRITARKFVERFEIERNKEVEIVDKERLIAVINKSIEEAVAKTEVANAMKALAATEEQVVSAREQEVAERAKRISLIEAAARTERETQRLVSIATAEKEAMEQRALAEIAEANAAAVRYERDAEGQTRLNEAENMRNDAARRSAIYENLIKNLPSIIRETVKPMENIESIKILQVDGVPGINSPSETGGGNIQNSGGGGGGGNITDRVVNSALKYRTQVAFVDGLMKDLGLPIATAGSAGALSFRDFTPPPEKADGSARKVGKSGKDDN